jgi:hypothetical protein
MLHSVPSAGFEHVTPDELCSLCRHSPASCVVSNEPAHTHQDEKISQSSSTVKRRPGQRRCGICQDRCNSAGHDENAGCANELERDDEREHADGCKGSARQR